MKRRTLVLVSLIFVMIFLLSACIPGDGKHIENGPVGFLWGIWHGWIAPISLIMGLFDHNIRVYEPVNTGWWYDFGFYMAIIGGFGGLSLARRSHKKEND